MSGQLSQQLSEGPLLWFLNRGTGISLILVLSCSVALGVLSLRGRAAGDGGARVPRFVTQALHRNLALGSVLLLLAHIGTAVLDSYVDIRWWDALLPWGAAYEPLWLAAGTLSFDLMLAIVATSALRGRIGIRAWRAVHLTAWVAWILGVLHGVMIGTDLSGPDGWRTWSVAPTLLGVGIVAAAALHRLLARPGSAPPQQPGTAPAPLTAVGSR